MNCLIHKIHQPVSLCRSLSLLAGGVLWLTLSPASAGIAVTQNGNATQLGNALQGSGLTINSATITNGDPNQFGTFSGFSLIRNGIVLSSGPAIQTQAAYQDSNDTPSNDMNVSGTHEFDAYGFGTPGTTGTPGIPGFVNGSFDVAALQVNFTLASPSAIAFDLVFGAIEYPNYVNSYADSFLVFLDKTDPKSQIVFDATGAPVDVGSTFANHVITSNAETAFFNPHGILPPLTTTTGLLSAGQHTLWFEVGDVNDHILDSAAFIANLHVATPTSTGEPETDFTVPEPSALLIWLLVLATFSMTSLRQRLTRVQSAS